MGKLNPEPPCYPDDPEGCDNQSYYIPITMALDPADPDNQALVFAYDNVAPADQFVEVRDMTSGDLLETFALQTTWGDLSGGGVEDVVIDSESWRVLVTVYYGLPDGTRLTPVIAIVRYTGEQTLLHDGTPPAGTVLPRGGGFNAALDTRTDRIILVGETGGYYDCPGDDYALNLATGELAPL